MTAIKKTTSSAKNSPAPAIKNSKPVPKKKSAAVASRVRSTPEPVRASAPPVAKARSAVGKQVGTTITAIIDVGFGNALYLRGEGPGLSWDRGVLMTCLADDRWQIKLPESAGFVLFKFLINDTTWSLGADFTIASGESAKFEPGF